MVETHILSGIVTLDGASPPISVNSGVYLASGISVVSTTTVASGLYLASGISVVSQTTVASGLYLASGISVIASASGNAVTTSVSGNVVSVSSGAISVVSGEVHVMSGVIQAQTPSKLFIVASGVGTIGVSGVTSLSGGSILSSGACISITLRNLSGNNTMYVGSTTTPPFSGCGFMLGGGDSITLAINNFNLVAVQAATSGQLVSYIGIAY